MKPGLWAEIHRLKEFEHLSGRAIAKRLHCGTRTVRNALESQDPPSQPMALTKTEPRSLTRIDPARR
jgi:DNA-binding transcriptional regulator YiaG